LLTALNLPIARIATKFEDVDGAMILKFAEMLVRLIVFTLIRALLPLLLLLLKKRNVDLMEVLSLEECSSLLESPFLLLEHISFIDGEPEESLIIENSSKESADPFLYSTLLRT